MATPSTCSSKEALARLWLHEACRVFADRLVCEEDRQQLQKMLVRAIPCYVLVLLSTVARGSVKKRISQGMQPVTEPD